ncbi:MAG: CPBP family intramembrane metalloprotease [Planctomycetota bacterium]|nr:MAG: CPBP family intramembrane metalloprotease [Planctomycetota bacterium]
MLRFLFLYAGMIVFAAWLGAQAGCPSLFRLPPTGARLVLSLAAAAAVALLVVQGGKALERVPWYRRMAALMKRMLTAPDLLGPELDAQKAFVIAVYSSVGEEALFRGVVQPYLIGRLGELSGDSGGAFAVGGGVLLSSLIFGAMHFPVVRELRPWTVFAVAVGAMFGVLAVWSESLLAPVLAHLLINWLNMRRLAALPLADPAGPAHP